MSQIKCPGCGAPVDVIEDQDYQFCQFCGTKIDNKTTNYADAAVKISRMRYEHEKQEEERNERQKYRDIKLAVIIFGGWILLSIAALIVLGFIKGWH